MVFVKGLQLCILLAFFVRFPGLIVNTAIDLLFLAQCGQISTSSLPQNVSQTVKLLQVEVPQALQFALGNATSFLGRIDTGVPEREESGVDE